MNYFSTDLSTLGDYPFRRSSFEDRGVWLTLLAYCVLQENGGRIVDAELWTDFETAQVLGVPRPMLTTGTHYLWRFERGDLIIWQYPREDQQALERQREANAIKGRIRAQQERIRQLSTGSANGSTTALDAAQHTLSTLYAELSALGEVRLGEVRLGKEKKNKRSRSGSILPADQPEPIRSRLLAINEVKNRLPSTRWSAKEFASFQAAGLHLLSDDAFREQVDLVRDYYAQPAATFREMWHCDEGDDFRRREVETLLNNWPGEVDRARAAAHWLAKKLEVAGAGRL